MTRRTGDAAGLALAEGDQIVDAYASNRPGNRWIQAATAIAEAHEDRRGHVVHRDVAHDDGLDYRTVHRFDGDAAVLVRRGIVRTSDHRAVADCHVADVPARLRADLQVAARAAEGAVGDRHVLGGAELTERQTRLDADGVVPRVDVALADAHEPA